MNASKNGLKKRIKSFEYAFTGWYELAKSEPNARIHLVAAVGAITAGYLLHISKQEWCFIVFAIALVWAAEGFNTVIEKLVDHLFTDYHETARIAKDVSAGAVLICAVAALICGLIIFLPKLFSIICG
ncbi:MAG: diacylglycerol kinase family protein [Bacteroidota bacterium]|nr:diacylglycerol kinase family protein [Bacteroidota bacterium]